MYGVSQYAYLELIIALSDGRFIKCDEYLVDTVDHNKMHKMKLLIILVK